MSAFELMADGTFDWGNWPWVILFLIPKPQMWALQAVSLFFCCCFFLRRRRCLSEQKEAWKQKRTKIPTPAWMFRPNNQKISNFNSTHSNRHPAKPFEGQSAYSYLDVNMLDDCPGIPTTIKTMGVNITTIAFLRVLIIEIGSTIIFMVVEAQGLISCHSDLGKF